LKFLIAGLGSIGRRHLHNLLALGERDILLFRTHQSTLPDDELDSFPAVSDLSTGLAYKPDAVIVSNPTALHLDVALPAAEAGCDLLLEKPIAAKLDERMEDLRSLVERHHNKVLVGFQFRFHPVLMQVRDELISGRLGPPLSFHAHWGEFLPDWHPWEDYRKSYAARGDLGGGVVNTLCHPLDYARWLFGEAVSLSAMTGKVSDLELDVEDVAEISLKFKDGFIGSIHLDYYQKPAEHWLRIDCQQGQILWDNSTGIAKIHHAERDVWEVIEPPVGFERNDLFLEEMRHFLQLIKGEVESRCTLLDGIKALEMTEAVHLSAKNGNILRPHN
jgi:predicted dehydrogenase